MKDIDFSLLSVGQLADKLGVTSATIRRWYRVCKLTETTGLSGTIVVLLLVLSLI